MAGLTPVAADKAAARKAAFAARAKVRSDTAQGAAQSALSALLATMPGRVVSGYLPIRTEIDPTPVMAAYCRIGQVCVPVVQGPATPLRFVGWTPDCPTEEADFGVQIPVGTAELIPDILIVPLAAFDSLGFRLGYGGGFYDRTLADLRPRQTTLAIGFAFAGQQVPAVPREPTDQPLDMIVTEAGLQDFQAL